MEMELTNEIEFKRFKQITQSFFDTILFLIFNYSRGPSDWKDNFILRVSDEFIEGLESIEKLIENGFRNQCRRELRFLIGKNGEIDHQLTF
jgi:hypothetical protein